MPVLRLRPHDLILTPEALGMRDEVDQMHYSLPRILRPENIPAHPFVLHSDFYKSGAFIDNIFSAVLPLVMRDIETIEKTLGESIDIAVRNDGIYGNQHRVLYTDIERRIDSNGIELGGAFSLIKPGLKCISIDCVVPWYITETYAVPPEFKKGTETDSRPQLYTWHCGGMRDYGLPWQLFARNYAIAFNNIGLDRLGL